MNNTIDKKVWSSIMTLLGNYTGVVDDKEMSGVCDIISTLATQAGYPIVNNEGSLLIYDGKRWVGIQPFIFKVFIKEALTTLLKDRVKGCAVKNVDGACKQMYYTSMQFSTPSPSHCVNFQNGILDLSGDKPIRKAHTPSAFFRYVLPYDYDPNATCPEFFQYLNRVIPDKTVQKVMAEFCGWVLDPETKQEVALFLWGKGRNGKSVFLEIIEAALGVENISHESLSDLCGEMGDRSRANICGKLLNSCSDVAPDAFHGDIFKRLVSGEPISTRRLYEDICSTTDYGKQMFCLNELPKTNDHSDGYYRRFLIIPFEVQIPKEEIDRKLASRIIANELPGVMNWILEGRERLVKNGTFSESEALDKALDDYRNAGQHKE